MFTKALLLVLVLTYSAQAATQYTLGEASSNSFKGTPTDGTSGAMTIPIVYTGGGTFPIAAGNESTVVCCTTAVSSTSTDATALKDKCWATKVACGAGATCNNAGKAGLTVSTRTGTYAASDKFTPAATPTTTVASSGITVDDAAKTYSYTITLTDAERKLAGIPTTKPGYTATVACYSEFNVVTASALTISGTSQLTLPTANKKTLTMGGNAFTNMVSFGFLSAIFAAYSMF